MEIKLIKNNFNNRLIIIDEAHKLRGDGDSKNENKRIKFILEKIAKYSENTRILFLTATPM